MNDVIGKVNDIEGKFFAKDANGKIIELNQGDEIAVGMVVFGDNSNTQSGGINILLNDGRNISVGSRDEQLMDESIFSDEEAEKGLNEDDILTASGEELIDEELSADFAGRDGNIVDVNSDLRSAKFADEEVILEEEDEEGSEDDETEAGDEEEKGEESGAQFANRDGNAVDVNSDLRNAKFISNSHNFEPKNEFENETEGGLESIARDTYSPSTPEVSRPTPIPSTPVTPPTPPTPPTAEIPRPPILVEPPVTPTEVPAVTIIKIVAADINGNPLKDTNGNYIEVNETPEGGATYYVALAFKPDTTVFNDDSKLDIQNGTVDFTFTDGTAKGNDYDPQNDLTGIELGSPVKADALDDYLSDNGEKLTVSISNYIPGSSSYGETTIDNSNVTTTIYDNTPTTQAPDNSGTPDDPTNGSYGETDTVYLQLSQNDSVNEGAGETLTHKFTLVDKDGNLVNIPTGETIDVTLIYAGIGGVDGVENEDFTTKTTTFTITGDGGSSYNVSNIVADDYIAEGTEGYTVSIGSIDSASGTFENIAIDTANNSAEGRIVDNATSGTETDVDTVKIVLVAVDDPTSVTTVSDLPVDGNGVLIIDNDNITSEGGKFYYIPVAVDEDGKPLTTQDGTVDLTYTNIDTTGADYVSTKVITNIGEVFSVDALVNTPTGEPNEDFSVKITNPQNTPYETPVIDTTNDTVTSTIDGRVFVKIINNDTQIEGNDLTHTLVLTDVHGNEITADVPTGESITVTLQYSNDETTAGDFTAGNGKAAAGVSFDIVIAGDTHSQVITNKTIDDFFSDNNEDYTLTITNVAQSHTSYVSVEIIEDEKSVTGTILDGVTLGDPADANVDEDNFDMEAGTTSITDTQSLNIVSPDGDNAYNLLFDGTPSFTSDDGSFNTADGDTLKSDGTVIEYVTSGNTTTAYAGAGRTEGDRVFVITLDKNNVGGTDDSYTYTQYKNIDHPISGNANATDDDDVVLTFGYKITDKDSSNTVYTSSVENFTVTVSDSLPSSVNQNVTLNEDGSKIIYISDESFENGVINLDNGVDGAVDVANGDPINIYDTAKNDVVGTLTNNGNGTVTFNPNGDYSGPTAGFTYIVSDGDGDTSTATVAITVKPVADAPTLADKTVSTWEDANTTDAAKTDGNQREGSNVKVLGLVIPVKEDQSDQNDNDVTDDSGTSLGDNSERLGAIEFSFATSGDFGTATIGYDTNNDGTLDGILQTITKDSTFTVDINNVANYHVVGTSGTYSLTQAQYESIAIMHDEDNAKNIKTKIAVASHEVQEDGSLYAPDIVSSEASQIVTLDVKAVTDDITALEFNTGANKTHTYTIPGGTTEGNAVIDISALLKNQDLNDNDGSENRWYEISGLPEGSVVTLGTSKATVDVNGDVKVNFPDNQEPNPTFTIEFPEQYSATGINLNTTITLKVQDTDGDSSVTPDIKTDSVTFNITGDIAPVADIATIQVSQAVGFEDAGRDGGNTVAKDGTINANGTGGIPLDIKVSSDDKDGSETFDVTISGIPTGAVIYYDGAEKAGTSITILDFDNTKSLVIIPPHNDDTDFTLNVSAVTNDGGTVAAPTNTTIDVIVKNVADAPVGTELKANIDVDEDNQLNFLDVYTTPAALASYDDTEVLTVKIDMPTGFTIDSGSPFYIEDGMYVVKASDITAGNIKLIVPTNFSGDASFDLTYVTTEKAGEGDSKTWNTQTVDIFVNPIADDVIVTPSSTINEDADGNTNKVNLQPNLSDVDADGNETIDSVKILASDVPAGYELYLDSAMTTSISSKLVGLYYVLTEAEADSVYAKNTTEHDADNVDSFDLTVVYTVTDTNGGTDTKDFTHTHTVNVQAVTDAPTLTLGTITQESGSVTIVGSTVTVVNENSQFKVPVTTTSSDTDGSEAVTKIVISGVPMGVEVVGGTYYGYSGSKHNGIWEIVAPADATLDANGALSDITFKVNTGADFDARDITITTYTQDGANAEVKSDSQTIHIDKTYISSGPGTGTPPLFDLSTKAATIYEDNNDGTSDVFYNLGKSIAVANSGGSVSGNYAITLTDFPAGTTVTGASYSYEEGGQTYYVVVGTGNAADVEAKLSTVVVTPPADMNTGGDINGQMTFSATISTFDGGTFKDGTGIPNYTETIIPVTDAMTVAVSADNIDEDGTSNISITLTNPNDGTKTELLNNSITIKVTETWADVATGSSTQSTLTDSSGKYNVVDNGNGTYTITPILPAYNFTVGVPITGLQYTSTEHRDGSVSFEVSVQNKENGSGVTLDSTGNANITVAPIVDVVLNAAVVTATGTEDTALTVGTTTLANPVKLEIASSATPDGSEKFGNIILDEVPNGFTVWYNDGTNLVMATNIGTTGGGTFDTNPEIIGDAEVTRNKWLVPATTDGSMPEVYINAPTNWSGDFDFDAIVNVKEQNLSTSTPISVNVTGHIDPVADGMTIAPTLTFGDAFSWVDLKLNANMADVDGSETMSLEITGLDDSAQFRLEDGTAVNATLDGATWKLSDIAYDQINNIQLAHDTSVDTVTVTAKTLDGTSTSSTVTDTFELKLSDVSGTITLDTGVNLDFSKLDNLSNVDSINLTTNGVNEITNLKLSDVLTMTDSNNKLTITGDAEDNVAAVDTTGWTKEAGVDNGTSTDYVYSKGSDTVTLTVDDNVNNTGLSI